MLRIAIIGARGVPARYGGWDTVATELAPRLVERGCDVTVYCQPRYSLPERPAVYGGVHLVYLPAMQRRWLENLSHEAVCLAHAMRASYDVIYVLGTRAAVFYGLARLGRRTVFFNTDGHDWMRRKWSRLGRWYLRWSEGVAVRVSATRLISDSQAIAHYFDERYGVQPTFIPYGAPPALEADPALLSEWGLSPGEYVLAVCRLEPENNVDVMVDAFNGLDTDKRLVVVGDTNYPTSYVEGLKRAAGDKVTFLGWLWDAERLAALMQHSYAYLHGHEVGGTNPSLLQAMAAACSVLANDNVFNREVLGDAGTYWSDVASLRAALRRALDDPQLVAATRERARRRVADRYDWEDVADRHLHCFERALAAAGGRRREVIGPGPADAAPVSDLLQEPIDG